MALYQRLIRSRNEKISVNRRYQCDQKCDQKSASPISPTDFYARFHASDGAASL